MNKRIKLTELGGFPMTQYSLQFMQDSYRNAFAALAFLLGDKVILSGMAEAGGNVTDGWIAVGGEIIPFIGGALGDQILIEETAERRVYQDGASKEAYFTRQARFGSPGGMPYGEFTRLATIKQLFEHTEDTNNPHETTLEQIGYTASDDPDSNQAFGAGYNGSYKELADRIKILHTGNYHIGDVPAGDSVYTIIHNKGILFPYLVFGSIQSSGNYPADNELFWCYYGAYPNGFKLSIQEADWKTQNCYFSYMLVKL